MQFKIIKSESEYEAALAKAEALIDAAPTHQRKKSLRF